MDFLIDDLNKNVQYESKIKNICSFNNVKCEFQQGKILIIKNTNISFIKPHQININIKDKQIILIYINEDNLFLYNRTMPITMKQLDILLKELKKEVI